MTDCEASNNQRVSLILGFSLFESLHNNDELPINNCAFRFSLSKLQHTYYT